MICLKPCRTESSTTALTALIIVNFNECFLGADSEFSTLNALSCLILTIIFLNGTFIISFLYKEIKVRRGVHLSKCTELIGISMCSAVSKLKDARTHT
jgi:hypothetical protein